MHLTFWSVAAPILFWGGLYFVPLPRALKIVIAIFVLAVGWSGYASAQALPASPFPVSTTGNAFVFSGGTATASNAASITFGNAANGAVYADVATSVRTAGGTVVPVVARSAPSALAVAKTVVGGLALVSNVGVALVAGVALYDFAKERGFFLDNSTGVLTVTKTPSSPYTCLGDHGPNQGPTYVGSGWTSVWSFIVYSPTSCSFGYRQFNSSFSWSMPPSGYMSPQYGGSVAAASPVPSTLVELEQSIAAQSGFPVNSKVGDALRDAVKAGAPLALPKPVQITGPLEVVYPPKTVTNPDGTKTVTTTKEKITYGPDGSIKVDTETSVKTLDAAGNPTGTTVTTESPAAPKPDPITCGLPGTPACAIDETGTPKDSPLTDAKIKEGTDAATAAHKNLTDTIVGNADKNWSWTFLGAPPVAQCEVVQFPAVMGVTPPVMNPCGTVDGIRAIMSWIWAFVGFYMCIGYVREVI